MARWLILAALIVVLTAISTIALQGISTESKVGPAFPTGSGTSRGAGKDSDPKVVVNGALKYEFGVKAQQTKFSRDWEIRNEGKGPLVLRLEAPACSCTVANFQGEDGNSKGTEISLPPGGHTPIHFTWDTRTYTGKYRKPAVILTNDPEHPRLEFAAEGEVQPAVVVYPNQAIEFLDISTDEASHPAGVALYSPDHPDFKILKLTSSRPDFIAVRQEPLSAEDCKVLKTKEGHRVLIDVKRGMPLGAFREEVVVATDHPKLPELRLTLTGKMVGPISVIPDRLRIHNVSSSKGEQRILTLLVRGQPTTRFEVQHTPDQFRAEVVAVPTPAAKSARYELKVTIPPGVSAGTIDDRIILKTDHPQAAEVRIPVDVIILDPS